MTKKEYGILNSYLANGSIEVSEYFEKDENGQFTGKFKTNSNCKLVSINKIFGSSISCSQYDVVAHGEGNEEEKIDSIYSSSLQSLLFFYGVSESNPIHIGKDKDEFNKVLFEYENPVIRYPSSMDVVLLNEEKGTIAFVESKYLEIIRDSNKDGNKVVGVSYFRDSEKSGYKSLSFQKEDLEKMRIEYPGNPYIDKVVDNHKMSISALDDKSYVYSEGIKQILSHIIGIQNFKKVETYSSFDPIKNHKLFKKVIYVELYNSFEGINDIVMQSKINDFKEHCKIVKKVITSKEGLVDKFLVKSYQDLAKANDNYKIDTNVEKYYRLK